MSQFLDAQHSPRDSQSLAADFATFLDQTADLIVVYGPDLHLLAINTTGSRRLNLPASEAIGKPIKSYWENKLKPLIPF
ncbi:MAG: hypothetical protein HC934_08665 [Acaryochloridaceae cyanobacterium SU_2_1]|nr:hypothetical protein [Acaryochloridaceae cyanobacterium SU_2_1]